MWPLLVACLVVAQPVLFAWDIPPEEYRSRRLALGQETRDGVVILIGAPEPDLRSPFFQESNFYYLSGWTEPGAILAIRPDEEILFIPRRNPEKEKWTGAKTDPFTPDIRAITGFEKVATAESFESWLAKVVEAAPKIYTLLDSSSAEKLKLLLPLREFADAAKPIGRLRMRKSPAELALIRRSVDATVEAHRAAWKRIQPGLYEYQIAAQMAYAFANAGCARPAYAPILGSGPAANVLHYSDNTRRIDNGELVLMDAGAECDYYAADVTRTVPVTGRFTKRQRELYERVLAAQRAAIAAVKPGMTLGRLGSNSLYQVACNSFNQPQDAGGDGLCKYFTHGIGHHVGLDVHDPDDPAVPLEPSMVITIEPGLYLPDENLGIRIEDMVVVTEDGCEVLSDALPKEPDAIERILSAAVGPGTTEAADASARP